MKKINIYALGLWVTFYIYLKGPETKRRPLGRRQQFGSMVWQNAYCLRKKSINVFVVYFNAYLEKKSCVFHLPAMQM